MKNTKFLALAAIIAGGLFLGGCSKDDTTTPTTPTEVITISFPNGTTVNALADNSYTLVYEVNAVNKIDNIKIFEIAADGSSTEKLALTKDFDTDKTHTGTYKVENVTTAKKIQVKVVDKNKVEKLSAIVTINPKGAVAAGDIYTYTGKTLGDQTSSSGSSFNAYSGLVYTMADAKTNASSVDFVYFNDANLVKKSEGAVSYMIAAPSYFTTAGMYSNATNEPSTWSVRNATKFYPKSSVTWADVTNDTKIKDACVGNTSNVVTLANGDIIPFETASGYKGLIRVTTTPGATVKLDVKIQKQKDTVVSTATTGGSTTTGGEEPIEEPIKK